MFGTNTGDFSDLRWCHVSLCFVQYALNMRSKKAGGNSGRGSGALTTNALTPVLHQQEYMNSHVQDRKALPSFQDISLTTISHLQHILNHSRPTM